MNFRFSPCLEFLPRSQNFGKGTPFQKPQSVRYPAWMPYRNSLCSACRRISCKICQRSFALLKMTICVIPYLIRNLSVWYFIIISIDRFWITRKLDIHLRSYKFSKFSEWRLILQVKTIQDSSALCSRWQFWGVV